MDKAVNRAAVKGSAQLLAFCNYGMNRVHLGGNRMKIEKNMFANVRKNKILLGMIGLLGAGLVMAGTWKWEDISAYFTDMDGVTNTFTTGKVDIDVEEPDWPGDQTDLVPGDILAKDPQVTSKASTPSFVYLQVKVPVADVTMVNDDGTRTEKMEHQLITYGCGETADATEGEAVALDRKHGLVANINGNTEDSWTLVKSEETATDANLPVTHYRVYTYAYNKVLLEGETTKPLFEKVRLLNVIEGELDQMQLDMPVKAFAIQAAHTGTDPDTPDDGNEYPTDPLAVQQEARLAYEKYLNQNMGNGEKDASADIGLEDAAP